MLLKDEIVLSQRKKNWILFGILLIVGITWGIIYWNVFVFD